MQSPVKLSIIAGVIYNRWSDTVGTADHTNIVTRAKGRITDCVKIVIRAKGRITDYMKIVIRAKGRIADCVKIVILRRAERV